jgi:hypothetical protein
MKTRVQRGIAPRDLTPFHRERGLVLDGEMLSPPASRMATILRPSSKE